MHIITIHEAKINLVIDTAVSFTALTVLGGRQEGHPACRKLGVGLLVVMILLEFCAPYSSSCHQHLHHP